MKVKKILRGAGARIAAGLAILIGSILLIIIIVGGYTISSAINDEMENVEAEMGIYTVPDTGVIDIEHFVTKDGNQITLSVVVNGHLVEKCKADAKTFFKDKLACTMELSPYENMDRKKIKIMKK